jgi:hypothetical protein
VYEIFCFINPLIPQDTESTRKLSNVKKGWWSGFFMHYVAVTSAWKCLHLDKFCAKCCLFLSEKWYHFPPIKNSSPVLVIPFPKQVTGHFWGRPRDVASKAQNNLSVISAVQLGCARIIAHVGHSGVILFHLKSRVLRSLVCPRIYSTGDALRVIFNGSQVPNSRKQQLVEVTTWFISTSFKYLML